MDAAEFADIKQDLSAVKLYLAGFQYKAEEYDEDEDEDEEAKKAMFEKTHKLKHELKKFLEDHAVPDGTTVKDLKEQVKNACKMDVFSQVNGTQIMMMPNIDSHGMELDEALATVREWLGLFDAFARMMAGISYNPQKMVLKMIVGQGNHSKNYRKPAIKPAVEAMLDAQGRRWDYETKENGWKNVGAIMAYPMP